MRDHERWERRRHRIEARHDGTGRVILGFGLLAVGVVAGLGKLGVADMNDLLSYWPALLILFGAARLVGWPGARRTSCGVFWLVVGSALLASVQGWISIELWDLWPVILVAIGAKMILRALYGERIGSGEPAPPAAEA